MRTTIEAPFFLPVCSFASSASPQLARFPVRLRALSGRNLWAKLSLIEQNNRFA